MRNLLRATILAAAVIAPASAKTVSLPDGKPAMSAVLPDSWKPAETERGMEATSPNGDVYASVEYAKDYKADLQALMEANGKWMVENKIVPNSPTTQDRDFDLNGLPAHEIAYVAHDKDGATKVTFTLIELPRDAIGVVTIWASDKERASQSKTVNAILNSVKAIK